MTVIIEDLDLTSLAPRKSDLDIKKRCGKKIRRKTRTI